MHIVLTGFLLSLSLCLDIGVVNVMLIRTGLTEGARPAFLIGLGSCFGDLIYAILSLFGITALLKFSIVGWILWLGGTVVLLYFTGQMLHQTIKPKHLPVPSSGTVTHVEAEPFAGQAETVVAKMEAFVEQAESVGAQADPAAVEPWRRIRLGLTLALSSPTAILWFATLGGSLIAADGVSSGYTAASIGGFYVGFFSAGLVWCAVISLVTGKLGARLGAAFFRIVSASSTILFAYFTWHVFWQGLASFG